MMAEATASAGNTHTPRWGMVIDVNRCVGCQTCTIACKHANDTLPGVQWRRVIDVETGAFPDVERLFLVTGCQHCAEPPCVPVCPTGATSQRADGLVVQDYDICIGCGYCAVACPYQARTIAHDQLWYYGRETKQEQAVKHEERLGVAQKCTFCKDRVDAGLARGLTPGVDPEATPACSAACIAQAIQFGDFKNPQSNVSMLVRDNPHFQLNAELGTDPQIKYLYTTPAVPGRAAGAAEADQERLSDPSNPLVGQLQTFWDWRAAMNWIFGGISSGTAVVAWLASLAGIVPADRVSVAYVGSAVLMAMGLSFVFLKIGRKLRFWRAVSRPQTSWMTREIYAVAVFYPAVLANLIWSGAGISMLVGIFAIVFLFCQAKILHLARGISAWRVAHVPWMIVASGLLEGLGLLTLMLLWIKGFGTLSPSLALAGLVLVALNAGLWASYRASAAKNGIVPLSRRLIDKVSLPLHLAGHAFPAVMFVLALASPDIARVCLGAGSIAALAGGAFWKFMLIVRGGYQQGFSLPMLPQRGSGTRAAPARA
ncbi:MAG TPA: DmsC/YnfH family molybdoenzyme membrane anchor subunit [Burkholderiales bacterium]|nr:DmsC/YnfH family molybdoenzyme membrane anchor subunit [Burkholderiales bacterium]